MGVLSTIRGTLCPRNYAWEATMRFTILSLALTLLVALAVPAFADEARSPEEPGRGKPTTQQEATDLLAGAPVLPQDVIDAALLEPVAETGPRLDRRSPELWPIGGQGKPYKSPWTIKLGLAASMSRGNNDTVDVLIDGRVKYERNKVVASMKVAYVYGEADGATNAENWHAQARFERKLRGKGYLFGKYNFDQDRFADLDYRHTALAGWGYTIIDREKTKLSGELGGGMAWEQRVGLAPTANPSAYFGLDFETEWGDGNNFTLEYDFVPYLNDFDLSYMTWDAKFGTPVCQGVDITIGVRVNWVFEPPAPTKPVDLLMSVGIRLEV